MSIGYLATQDSVVVRSGETTHVRFRLAMPPLRVDTLPPRIAKGTRPDTAPDDAETIDRVARVARLPALRPQPANRAQRELRIWVGGGIGIPMRLLRITDDGTRVRGEQILWLMQIDTRAQRRRPAMARVPGQRAGVAASTPFTAARCRPTRRTTPRRSRATRTSSSPRVACSSTREPDWRAVLAELERHHVWNLPDASELPVVVTRRQVNEEVVTVDGVGVTVEAWNGTRYRAYTIGNPDQQPFPEYRDAAAILRLVIGVPDDALTRLETVT